MAEATNINRMTLSKILNQKGYGTGTDVLDKLYAYFDCRLDEIAEHLPEQEEEPAPAKPAKRNRP